MRFKHSNWDEDLDKKLAKFSDRLYTQIRKEFGVDSDGEPPVSFALTDRTKFERPFVESVPYLHKAKTAKDITEIEAALISNLSMACDALMLFRKMQSRKLAEKESNGQ